MQFYGDKICVLCLKKNFNASFQDNFKQFVNPIEYEIIEGVKNPINEGHVNVNLWQILNHATTDPVSCDIFRNHLSIIRKYFQEGARTAFIMEEDARFPDMNANRMAVWEKANQWMKVNETKWDIFYFGYCCWPVLASFWTTNNIVRLPTPLCAHAYVMNRSGMEKVLNYLEGPDFQSGIHIDKLYVKIPTMRKYGCFPMLSYQEHSPALYVKACDILNKDVTFKSFCQFNERLCLSIPFIFLALFFIILYHYLK